MKDDCRKLINDVVAQIDNEKQLISVLGFAAYKIGKSVSTITDDSGNKKIVLIESQLFKRDSF